MTKSYKPNAKGQQEPGNGRRKPIAMPIDYQPFVLEDNRPITLIDCALEEGGKVSYQGVKEFAKLVANRRDNEAKDLYRKANPSTQEAIRTKKESRLWFKALNFNVAA